MIVEFILNFDDEDGIPEIENLVIDIDENASINELFSKIHEMKEIPKYREVKWGDTIEKVPFAYFYKTSSSSYDEMKYISDLEKKIKDFPKNGKNGELSLYIEKNVGLVN